MPDPLNAFCTDSDAYLPGASDGPLAGLTFAAKDIFDVAGHVTRVRQPPPGKPPTARQMPTPGSSRPWWTPAPP